MKKKQIKVIYKKFGLANNFGNYIEIHEKLKYNKPLRDYVVKHELGHKKHFDLNYDFSDGLSLLKKPDIAFSLLYLYLTTPSMWVDFLPIQYRNKQIIYDVNLTLLYLILLSLVTTIIYLFF
jgi:hypothetical protein